MVGGDGYLCLAHFRRSDLRLHLADPMPLTHHLPAWPHAHQDGLQWTTHPVQSNSLVFCMQALTQNKIWRAAGSCREPFYKQICRQHCSKHSNSKHGADCPQTIKGEMRARRCPACSPCRPSNPVWMLTNYVDMCACRAGRQTAHAGSARMLRDEMMKWAMHDPMTKDIIVAQHPFGL